MISVGTFWALKPRPYKHLCDDGHDIPEFLYLVNLIDKSEHFEEWEINAVSCILEKEKQSIQIHQFKNHE